MHTTTTDRRGAARFTPSLAGTTRLTAAARTCRRRFLRFFPRGFQDQTYVEWERGYKWSAHERWCELLRRRSFRSLLDAGEYTVIARYALAVEARTNLLFSFEKMALRDAVRDLSGARQFAEGLWALLYGGGSDQARFENWVDVMGSLPRRRTRVLTWPTATVWGFIAQPERNIYLKPVVTRRAAVAYGCAFDYESGPNWRTYVSLLEFAEQIREDQSDLRPRDMIDLQSFIWVQGSDEYEE
jgi:hypothetical protein